MTEPLLTTQLSTKSSQLAFRCPKCNKRVEIIKESEFLGKKLTTLSCGHGVFVEQLVSFTEEQVNKENSDSTDWTKFEDGRKLFPFQALTKDNIIKANGRCLLALDMGLGKTLCAISATRQLADQMKPILVITKSGLMLQWFEEYVKSSGIGFSAVIIENSNQKPIPGFPVHIVSYDLLRRLNTDDWNFKTVILDECQHIKNPTSSRTKKVREICAKAQYIIGTSGTPFKNNVEEYFTILNILRPDKHQAYSTFIRRWCKVVKHGNTYKTEGLRNSEAFLDYNKDFVFRFERAEVLPDLPKIFRHFRYVDLDSNVKDAYGKLSDQFTAFYDKLTDGGAKGISFADYSNILAFFAKMRHLAGLAKVEAGIQYVEEFLEQTDRKLTIFVHHKDVFSIISNRLKALSTPEKPLNVVELNAEKDIHQRYEAIETFRNDPNARIMVASTLASGEGLNLQFCSDCVMLERQWNPANEEQAEARFPRPGSLASVVSALYIVAINTIDEFLAELVEKKRQYVKEGLDGKAEVKWDESGIVKELAEILASKGKKKWSVK